MTRSIFHLAATALAASFVFACGERAEDAARCTGGKCDGPGGKRYVVDMRKAPPLYGGTGRYFWGVEMGEQELAELAPVASLLTPADQAVTLALGQQLTALGDGFVGATFKVIWDQLRDVAPGWPTLIFADAPAAAQGVAALNAAFAGQGVRYEVVVIDPAGRYVAAPGRLSVIPMQRETAPARQQHIKDALQDGDVITYVHPEYFALKNLMERRASHVAMHYELSVGEQLLVHHIDNPNGYGPQYNHEPSRHMPFHAFRFAGVQDPQAVQRYGLAARSWAMITNDLSPFAGFFDLRLQNETDLDRFVLPALQGQEIPVLYCSGLAYLNLNLGINRPLSPAGLGPSYGLFSSRSSGWLFSDASRSYTPAELGAGLEALAPWRAQDELVFQPYDATDMLNAWVADSFKGLPAQLGDSPLFSAPVLAAIEAQVAAQPELSAEQKQQVLGLYQAQTPFRMAVIKQVIQAAQFQQQVVGGFGQLEWGDSIVPPHAEQPAQSMPPATVKNAALWAAAFGLPASQKQAFISHPCAFIKGVASCDENAVVDTRWGAMGLQAAIDKARYDDPAFVAAVEQAETPMDVVRALARNGIANRFVPPRIWLDVAERPGGAMRYVGTVINCELLAAADGSDADPCAGSGGPVDHYKEGGADSHTYPSFGVRPGGQVTHRRVDASRGPELFGEGTKVTVSLTASRPQDMIFALHVPSTWQDPNNDPIVAETLGLAVWDYGDVCTARQQGNPQQTCAPRRGILLRPDTDGDGLVDAEDPDVAPVIERVVELDVMRDGHCVIIDNNSMECDLVQQRVEGGRTEVELFRGLVGRTTRQGYFAATMINLGAAQGETECHLRRRLLTADGIDVDSDLSALLGCNDVPGSAHFDGWRIEVWNRLVGGRLCVTNTCDETGAGCAGLKVRAGPSTMAAHIGTLAEGQAFDVVGEPVTDDQGGTWYPLQHDGFPGFVHGSYVGACP